MNRHFVPDTSGAQSFIPPASPTIPPQAQQAPAASDPLKFLPLINMELSHLPSKGLAYPANSTIKYRPYTFGEIKKASQSKVGFRDNVEFVLEGVDCNFDKHLLTLYDVMYLSLLRNISSVKGAAFKIEYQCGACGKRDFHEMDMAKIEFKDIDVPRLPASIEIAGKKVTFMPINLKMFYQLLELKKEEDEIALLAIKCVNLSFDEAYSIVNNLMGDDQEVVLDIDKMLNHEIKSLKFKCPNKIEEKENKKCGNEIEVELAGGEALIIPFRKSKNSARDRIQFG